jgi:uncharacterized protein with HEPN domain
VIKDPLIFGMHMVESIGKIEEFTKGMTRVDFMQAVQTQDAVIRRLEIIGAAAKNIPKSFRQRYPQTRWAEMARMRDKLIHHYFGVDLKITWNVVEKELPILKRQIQSILQEQRNNS